MAQTMDYNAPDYAGDIKKRLMQSYAAPDQAASPVVMPQQEGAMDYGRPPQGQEGAGITAPQATLVEGTSESTQPNTTPWTGGITGQGANPTPQTYAPGSMDWVRAELGKVNSSDDPNYWMRVIAADPKVAAGDQSAIAYWVDRIRRGDGSALVANGTLQKFQDGGGDGGMSDPNSALRQMLMQRIQGLSGPFDPNTDPTVQTVFNAGKDATQRQLEQGRQQIAERLYAQGDLNSGNLGEQVQQSQEAAALGLGQMKSQIVQSLYTQRRQELTDLYQMALASGDAQSARELQNKLALLDATVRREQLGAQMGQWAYQNNANTIGSVV